MSKVTHWLGVYATVCGNHNGKAWIAFQEKDVTCKICKRVLKEKKKKLIQAAIQKAEGK